MWDFLTFRRFVAQDVLILFYYTGAVAMPLFLWFLRRRLVEVFPWCRSADTGIKALYGRLETGRKTVLIFSFFVLFLAMELGWRLVFEAMIGYFQMHDALMELVGS